MKLTKYIIFDFDGVLADSESESLKSWRSIIEDPDSLQLKDICGRKANENAEILEGKFKNKMTAKEALEKKLMLDRSKILNDEIPLVANADKIVRELSAHYQLAIASSNSRKYIEKFLAERNLLHYFNHVVGSEDVLNHKPSPEPYLMAMALFNATDEECIAIEDSNPGIISATEAGMRVIGFGSIVADDERLVASWKSYPSVHEALSTIRTINVAHRGTESEE